MPSTGLPPTGDASAERAERDRPWLMRTYSGHTSAKASNALYRSNLAKGQTGLSVAFDLPTQTGYDPDDPLAAGEVGRVGVPLPHLDDMRDLFEGISLGEANTSMTINATAMWLYAMYIVLAEEQGAPLATLEGTTQNDIAKEYLSRGTYIFAPVASLRLTVDLITWSVRNTPRWNPINVCSYHLQEAGATPTQEIAFTLGTACAVLDSVKASGQVTDSEFCETVGRISFFVNSGIRFIEEICKMRAFASLWDRLCVERYGVTDEKLRRFRFGVQVNSLGLTEAQPENNVQRIVLEMLGVTLSKDVRARAVQLPTWNEALGLPRPWDQQWSLRMQQVLAIESDLLEYDDIFEGSKVIEAKTVELGEAAWNELSWILEGGGAFALIDELKARLVASHARRVRRIESGDLSVVGVNALTESEPSLLATQDGGEGAVLVVDPGAEALQRELIALRRSERDSERVTKALKNLRAEAGGSANLVPATLELVRAGGTVGEWAGALRMIFGEYRAPTGVGAVPTRGPSEMAEARAKIATISERLGRPIRILVGKPGLDGHSNGAEQIAVGARDAGMEVIYQGIRLTPEQIASAARDEDVDVVGLSVLSGAHMSLVPETMRLLAALGSNAAVVVGGIISQQDREALLAQGVSAVFTPKDYRIGEIMVEIAEIAEIAAERAR